MANSASSSQGRASATSCTASARVVTTLRKGCLSDGAERYIRQLVTQGHSAGEATIVTNLGNRLQNNHKHILSRTTLLMRFSFRRGTWISGHVFSDRPVSRKRIFSRLCVKLFRSGNRRAGLATLAACRNVKTHAKAGFRERIINPRVSKTHVWLTLPRGIWLLSEPRGQLFRGMRRSAVRGQCRRVGSLCLKPDHRCPGGKWKGTAFPRPRVRIPPEACPPQASSGLCGPAVLLTGVTAGRRRMAFVRPRDGNITQP